MQKLDPKPSLTERSLLEEQSTADNAIHPRVSSALNSVQQSQGITSYNIYCC